MKRSRRQDLVLNVSFTFASLALGASLLMAQDNCQDLKKVVADAFHKVHTTPTHVFSTTTMSGKAFTSEVIYAGGTMYMKINGKWSSAGSIQDMEQTEQDAQHNANSKDSCLHLKDEPVNGQMAAVYSSHSVTPKGSIDQKIWISTANGELLREDSTSSGAVMSARYEYENVKPPL